MPLCGSSSSSKHPIERKIVILGDGACGKTSLLNVFTRGYFPKVYEPTVFENYIHDIFVDNQHITLSLWDTAGQEEFDRLRSLSYSDTHTIMLCFSVDSRDSLENVKNKWVSEIADHCEGVKLVLVALKCDLRSSDEYGNESAITPGSIQNQKYNGGGGNGLIPYDEGLAMAKQIGALRYLECSAKMNRGVNEAFTEAARCALTATPKGARDSAPEAESSSCTIM
ncbi:ADL252Wp [Eremothecium gossypii ATCC 10895]|uniref:GTP-binding protein RHO3 n=1 Tax=Eremothecium gossypii (strain ATCC 10895 / CBS 109.51 / FGSC 9923 / NRRL Y-1056) TaxID=284811 RepID=RHO3_EREGS|nr:ADL252Wp [Eremothecium gossypii ATCC 10895]Q9HF51.1 RecName: Full=GTP-binding protein RHO3; Flags: Precursor [Eremothecium gossypii ATCC 10895]AAG41252.1 Rho3 [Eremothecium gossypii]AAS51668.1 ADL252Wp [Eremothecium gossypii ATCC 10895]AEY95965.1 FADL252Wp [Eremothecium gossypii FDAG1]